MNLVSKDISEDFPNSSKIYLNNASVSLMPLQSIEKSINFPVLLLPSLLGLIVFYQFF